MSTVLSYGGKTFTYVSVSWRAQAVYDEVGHTLQGHQLTFRCNAYLIGNQNPDVGAQQTRAAFQTELRETLDVLSKPRQKFLWTQGGTKIFEVDPGIASEGDQKQASNGDLMDRRYGPHPRVIDVRQIPGGLSANITFEIEVFTNLCAPGEDLSNVEEFWWRFSYSYDRNFNCTRKVTGRFRLRSAMNAAEEFLTNSSIWPRIPNGFYRESQEVSISTDNLAVDFSISDKQVWRTLPRPLTDGTATFRIEQRMAQLFKTLNMSFSAPLDVKKNVIMNFMTAMVRARFPDAFTTVSDEDGESTFREFFTNITITNYEFENRIDMSVTAVTSAARLISDTDDLQFNLFLDVEDVVPSDDPEDPDFFQRSDGQSEVRGALGTAGLVPEAYTPWEVCGQNKTPGAADTQFEQVKDTDLIKPERQDSNAAQNATQLSDDTEVPNPSTSSGHDAATYTSYYETWRYITVHNVRSLPVVATGEQDILQQTTRPQTRVVCTGAATRINLPPEIPAPAFIEDVDARVDYEEIGVDSPYLMADGKTLAYKCKWHYSVVSPKVRQLIDECGKSQNETKTCVVIPINPLYSNELNQEIQQQRIIHRTAPIEQDGDYLIDVV